MSSIRKSLAISFGQTYAGLVIQFLASLFIARLLTPAEMGVFSVSMVVIAIGQTLRDFGVIDYIVQEKDLTEAKIRAASLVTFLAAWCIAGIAFGSAASIATFYREPAVESLIQILALNFLLLPFGSVVSAYLRRQLKFGLLAKIRLTVVTSQAIFAVTLAYLGFSYYSMAWAAVAGSVMTILFMQLVRPKALPFLPGIQNLRQVLTFGSYNSISALIQEIGRGLPDLVLGRLLNMSAVGLFGRASGLLDLFNRLIGQAVNQVSLPHLSSRLREGHDIKPAFLMSVSHLTAIGWPTYLFLCLTAHMTIPFLYGAQWAAAIPVAQALALGEIAMVPFGLQTQFLIAGGAVKLEAYRAALSLLIRFAPLYFLADLGLEIVAIGYAIATGLMSILSFALIRFVFSIKFSEVLRHCKHSLGPLLGCGLATIAGLLLQKKIMFGPFLSLALVSFLFGCGWLIGLFASKHPLSLEISNVTTRIFQRQK